MYQHFGRLIFIGVDGAEREVLSWSSSLRQDIEEGGLPAHVSEVEYTISTMQEVSLLQ